LVLGYSFWLTDRVHGVLGFIQFVQPKTAKPLSVSIQGNIPQDLKWLTEYQIKTLEIYATLVVRNGDVI
jgi:apolipoprotein N-acyltransferase